MNSNGIIFKMDFPKSKINFIKLPLYYAFKPKNHKKKMPHVPTLKFNVL